MSIPRVPGGQPTGGQFAHQTHREPDDITLWSTDDATGALDDSPIPQADRLDRLSGVLDAISIGCDTNKEIAETIGMDGRQGAYYTAACHHLGFIEPLYDGAGQRIWGLTLSGHSVASSEGDERCRALADAVGDSEYVQMYLNESPEALALECRRQGLSPETTERRVQTIAAWANFVTSDDGQVRTAVANSVAPMRDSAASVFARRPTQQHRRQEQLCTSCHMLIPAHVTECTSCGEPLGT